MKLLFIAAGLALLGCAPAASAQDRIGRIYSYIRSDRDGAEAEVIRVYRRDRTHIEVSKMRGRCNNAAYVTATLAVSAAAACARTRGARSSR